MEFGVAVERGNNGSPVLTFDVLCQGLPCAGVLDAVSTPGGEELDQPGRGRVPDGGLEAAAAQDDQRVLLRVQAGGGSHTPGDEPQDERRFEPQAEHPGRTAGRGRWEKAGREPSGSRRLSADHRRWEPGGHESSSPAHIQATCVYSRERCSGQTSHSERGSTETKTLCLKNKTFIDGSYRL